MHKHEVVRELYNHNHPLGPHVAEEPVDAERLSLLFDRENKLVSQLNRDKSLIVGRKGSGKTTLLMSIQISEPDAHVIHLPPTDVFSQIVREINELSDGVVFVEQVSRLWDFVLWGTVFNRIASHFEEPRLEAYCGELGVLGIQEPYEVIATMLRKVKEFPPSDWPIPEKIAYKRIGELSLLQAKQIALAALTRRGVRVYLLLDSLEELKLHIPSFGTAVAGLLRCLGEFNEPQPGTVVLRCCLPTERYFEYTELSTNPLKDFRNALLLHWTAGELIHLCAVRYSRFLQEYYRGFFDDKIQGLELNRRRDLEIFWDLIFPEAVVNRLGIHEKPLAYVLRHTQLLPRHFIVYLNEILSRAIKQDATAFNISGSAVRDGVIERENLIVDQILQAYSTPFKACRDACAQTLSELRTTFSWSDFDAIANKVTKRRISGASNRGDLMSLLTEIGAIGRVVDESERYVEGVFEYMVPHKLVFSERDRFCVHPVFSEVFNVQSDYDGVKPIYTYWSGITDDDIRHWM